MLSKVTKDAVVKRKRKMALPKCSLSSRANIQVKRQQENILRYSKLSLV